LSFGNGDDNSPNEDHENDAAAKQVVDDEENHIDLGRIAPWLLVGSCDAHHNIHDVDPSLKQDNLKEDEQ